MKQSNPLRVALVGSAGHGRSALLGRLLLEAGAMWPATQVGLRVEDHDCVFIDVPAHIESLRDMVNRLGGVDAAVLVIDVSQPVPEQALRQAAALRLLGVHEVVVAVDEIDRSTAPAEDYARCAALLRVQLERLGLASRAVVPVAARDGANLLRTGDATPWYAGPTLAAALAALSPHEADADAPKLARVSGAAARLHPLLRRDDATRDDLVPVGHSVTAGARARRFGHAGAVIWMTGLSGAGKSTLAMALESALIARGYAAYVLDGDNLRQGLNADLGFHPDDRRENVRRTGEAAALFADAGLVCIVALISPYRDDRARARAAARDAPFVEVFVDAPLAVCESRDPKGLYRRARAHELRDFTGVDAPYEAPMAPDLVVDTARQAPAQSLAALLAFVEARVPRA